MRIVNFFVCLALGASLAYAACGDDGGSGGTSSEAAARGSVENARAIKGGGDDPDAPLAATYALQGDLQVMVQLKQAQTAQQQRGALRVETGALAAECSATSGGTTTYTDCKVGPTNFNGTVTVSGDSVSFNVTGDVDPDAYNGPLTSVPAGSGFKIHVDSVTFSEQGALSVTDTSIDGTLDATVTVTLTTTMPGIGEQTADQSTPLHAVYDGVQLDAAGCAVGGTLTVTSAQTTVNATFGPACGDVTVD